MPKDDAQASAYQEFAPFLCANLNAFALDYVARQKIPARHLNLFILEQLPVIPEDGYSRRIGGKVASEIIRHEVLKLTYTAHDMLPFAADMGHEGPPFVWDEEERRHSRARLDALYFLLYGIDRDDAAYILDTFAIVRRQDEQNFERRYVTKELILGYMAAFEAGDEESRITI